MPKIRPNGFSLVELLIVMAVLGILAAAIRPLAEITVQRERERELKQALWSIRAAIDAYKQAADSGSIVKPPVGSGYPPSLKMLVDGVPDARAGGSMRYFLRRIPRDPFMPPETQEQAMWGLRSFDSPPDQPKPGADVFDVYSRSTRLGLNGLPLRDW